MRRHRRTTAFAALAVIGLFTAACGSNREERSQSPTPQGTVIEVSMSDIAFEPRTLTVPTDATVTFRFTNRGQIPHDAFIGDESAQADHESEMRSKGDRHDDHGSDDEDAVTLDPNETGELTRTFRRPGRVEIGCHQPGHYAAGMKIAVTVT